MSDQTVIQGHDPRTAGPVGEPVPATGAQRVDALVRAAAAAFEPWRDGGRAARAAALGAVADRLDQNAAELVALADAETALGETRLAGEVARTTGQLRLFADVLADGRYQGIVIEPAEGARPDLRRIKRPLGPVAVFAASNFPFAFSVAGGDTASALAAGCPVIVKAHEAHPRTSLRTGELVKAALAEAGAPEGVFDLVFGVEEGAVLVRHPLLTAVGFTGSTRGGLALAKLCAQREKPIPFYGELGSVNPVIVFPGAARARAAQIADGYAASLTLGVGQFCTNPGVMFVPDEPGLLDAIGAAVSGAAGGPMLSERIHAGYVSAVEELGARDDVSLLAAGKPGQGPWAAAPKVFRTTLDAVRRSPELLTQEHFGPVGIVIVGGDPERAVRLIESEGGGNLTATVHADPDGGDDPREVSRVGQLLAQWAGRVVFNGWPTGVAVTYAQQHGGPFPATTAPAYTSVGAAAIDRWLVPVVYQDFPAQLLPEELR
ncbi:aldehyde dehydrogenase (NADP(+)) [Actinocrinis puniceicyclus]|uniref:Aldehyde dehydrogenase (NADP(+)) n=1 Tax=Actinocrinis puniceicyclus TaxID=977794 RepID=A0A8J7WI54_9ACTN|nr:aldehyde dehydrogenase (NADP(+)) [Actinocrinis puniceicyclus]MBS2962716.1 aldehyde dehydrogenase (NADP(+)) [Actinocrinis puniceicyclus]